MVDLFYNSEMSSQEPYRNTPLRKTIKKKKKKRKVYWCHMHSFRNVKLHNCRTGRYLICHRIKYLQSSIKVTEIEKCIQLTYLFLNNWMLQRKTIASFIQTEERALLLLFIYLAFILCYKKAIMIYIEFHYAIKRYTHKYTHY